MLEALLPAIGALLLIFWTASGAWALRPAKATAGESRDPALASLARARTARGRTRNGLLGAVLAVVAAFLAVRLLFVLPD